MPPSTRRGSRSNSRTPVVIRPPSPPMVERSEVEEEEEVMIYQPPLYCVGWVYMLSCTLCIPYPEGEDMTYNNYRLMVCCIFMKMLLILISIYLPMRWIVMRTLGIFIFEVHAHGQTPSTLLQRLQFHIEIIQVDFVVIALYMFVMVRIVGYSRQKKVDYIDIICNLSKGLFVAIVLGMLLWIMHLWFQHDWNELNKASLSMWKSIGDVVTTWVAFVTPRLS